MKMLYWRAALFCVVAVLIVAASGLLVQTADAAGHPRQGRLKCNNLPPGVQANATLTWRDNLHEIKGVQQSFNCKGNGLDSQPVTQPKNAALVAVTISFKNQNVTPIPLGTPCTYSESVSNNPIVWTPPPCAVSSDATFAIEGLPPVGGSALAPDVAGPSNGGDTPVVAVGVAAALLALAAMAWWARRRASSASGSR